jgi:pyruvate dehydrogenase E1 component beta subunit
MSFGEAVEDALAQAMAADPRVILFGEDAPLLRRNLLVRFGKDRVRAAPISESAFVGAAVGAAMAGLKPVVELVLVDFIAVALDAILNQAAKVEAFSGGRWKAPLVIKAACGGGYGDAGQHEQTLWGWLAHIPGLRVVVPSNPADAGGLLTAAIAHEGPVVFLEHKLLNTEWLDFLGRGGRETVEFDVPPDGASGEVPDKWSALPLGRAAIRREGRDVTLVSVGVGVHRALEAAAVLDKQSISAAVIDLRTVSPLDKETVCEAVGKSGRLLVVDEDYREFGLSGELAAAVLEAGIPAKFGRVCTETAIPYSRKLEEQVLPNTGRIVSGALMLF